MDIVRAMTIIIVAYFVMISVMYITQRPAKPKTVECPKVEHSALKKTVWRGQVDAPYQCVVVTV